MEFSAKDLVLREQKDRELQKHKEEKIKSESVCTPLTEITFSTPAPAEDSALILKFLMIISDKDRTIATLHEEIDYLCRKLYGTSREHREESQVPEQLSIYDLFLTDPSQYDPDLFPKDTEPEETEEVTITIHRKKKKTTQEEKYSNVKHEKVVEELPESKRFCQNCGTPLVEVGEKFVRNQLQFTPAKVTMQEVYQKVYKCPECEKNSDPTVAYKDLENPYMVTTPVQEALIPHSPASESIVACVINQKFGLGIPAARQEKYWNWQNVIIKRGQMCNWIIYCAEHYLTYMSDYLGKCLLQRKYLMADETTVQVLKEKDRKPTSKSYEWLFRTGEDGLPPITVYKYFETREGKNAADFLKGFTGYLETDGYSGYNKVEGIVRCGCWAHARRKLFDAIPKGHQSDHNLPPVQGVAYCDKLFKIEGQINERTDFSYDLRYELRLQQELPVLEAFWSWTQKQTAVKGSKFYTALVYLSNQKDSLMNYLKDGHCSLCNNAAERMAKSFVIGRKNWLFSTSPEGANANAVCYTIIETARNNSIDPEGYVRFLLEQRLHASMADEELEKLTPWNEDVQSALWRPSIS